MLKMLRVDVYSKLNWSTFGAPGAPPIQLYTSPSTLTKPCHPWIPVLYAAENGRISYCISPVILVLRLVRFEMTVGGKGGQNLRPEFGPLPREDSVRAVFLPVKPDIQIWITHGQRNSRRSGRSKRRIGSYLPTNDSKNSRRGQFDELHDTRNPRQALLKAGGVDC